ncbi:MAG: hypothetical protein Ct9H300mP2_2200 [Candidatus Neomarinimicrobiota bacterium]|nr:MAG: hypothetical protein Ct9H300mP2_2200 [Candidatus Neomarinimicrobiota bacterium]
MPVFQDLEIAAGALLGLGPISVSVDQRTGTLSGIVHLQVHMELLTRQWELAWLYEVDDVDSDQSTFSVKPIPGVLSDVVVLF